MPGMAHYLPVSRVARLVGKTRSAIQRMIQDNELATFDGMVEMNELLRVFPDVQWEDDGEYKRVEEIKAKAFGKRVFERTLPDKVVLAERLFELGRAFAAAKSLLLHYDEVLRFLGDKLEDVADSGGAATVDAVAGLKLWLKRELEAAPSDAERAEALLAQESVMRIMSANVTVQPSGHEFFVEGNDTILEAALRAGVPLNYGCSNGNCGECKARLVSGDVRKSRPHDYVLKEADKASNTLLMCSYTAVSDVVLETRVAGAEDIPHQTIPTKVKWVEPLNDTMVALHLTTPRSQRLRFPAGQPISVTSAGAEAEYYVASCPCDDRQITLHIRRDDHAFSRRVFDTLRKDDPVTLSGPAGRFVFDLDSRQPVIFVAWNDAFAPIKSLIQHAMSLELNEHMYLYWVADRTGHYRDNLCRSWADAYDNFTYVPLTPDGNEGDLVERILAAHPDMSRLDVYAAGPARNVAALQEAARARGLAAQSWHGEAIG